ncbi:MAG: MiaB/RimO family radical SAM methylthiotransferase [candidate division WOR-3 bacterium]
MRKFKIVFLGCPKNFVDTEHLCGFLLEKGFEYGDDGDHVFIQTCAFIKPAIEESTKVIKEYINKKKKGEIKFIGVGGCLPLRFKNIKKIFPEIDLVIKNLKKDEIIPSTPRFLLTKGFCYVKISEGCNERCSFCVIPCIRGNLRSREIDDILSEIKFLINNGFKEIILISQSTGQYGIDIYKKPYFKNLLKKIEKINGDFWVRMMYMHPADIDEEIVKIIKNSEKIVKYMDIPIQHFSENVLKEMRRRGGKKKVLNALEMIRNNFSDDFYIRTEVMVGFPSETDRDFEELLNGLKYYKINRIAIFKYYDEKNLKQKIPEKILSERFEEAQKVAMELMRESQKRLLNKRLKVLINEKDGKFYKGRTEFDAPEIDFEVYAKKINKIEIPNFYTLKIKNMKRNFDLLGEIC